MVFSKQWIGGLAVAVLLGAGASAPARVSAATIVVGPGGVASIQQAVASAGPETVIVIAPGTYAENIDLAGMGSATGAGNGDLVLVARDGPGTVQLTGSGVKLGSSAPFDGTLVVDGLNIRSSDEDAVRLAGFANLVIADSVFEATGNSADDSAVELSLASGTPHVVLFNNTFSYTSATGVPLGSAIRLTATAGAAPIVTIESNTISGPGSENLSEPRFLLTLLGLGATVTVRDNTFTNTPGAAMIAQLGDAGDKTLDISGNNMTGLQSVGISVTTSRGSSTEATIANNTIVTSGASAIELNAQAPATARILANQITNTAGSGIDAGARGDVPDSFTMALDVSSNTITRAARNGIVLRSAGASTVGAVVRDNRIAQPAISGQSQYSGFVGLASDTGSLTLAAARNTVDADAFGRSVLLSEQGIQGSVTRVEGNLAESVAQNLAAENTLAGSVAVVNDVGVVARGSTVPVREPLQLAVEDDRATATPQQPTTIDVLANDESSVAESLAFVVPLSSFDGFVTSTDTVSYTSAAGFVGADEVLYVARVGSITGVGRVSVLVGRESRGAPPNANQRRYLPLVGR